MHMNQNSPQVSILFPVHKWSIYADEAIKSLIQQDYENFTILFLDNSPDGIEKSKWNYSKKICYLRLDPNSGLSNSLNYGIKYSDAKYLIRMDYDDVCALNRISRQVLYMEKNREIGISGTSVNLIAENFSKTISLAHNPISNTEIRKSLIHKNPLFHPTVIFRRSKIIEANLFYNSKYDGAEDLELWTRAIKSGVLISNCEEILLHYRIYPDQTSKNPKFNTHNLALKIRVRYIIWLILNDRKLSFYALKSLKQIVINAIKNS